MGMGCGFDKLSHQERQPSRECGFGRLSHLGRRLSGNGIKQESPDSKRNRGFSKGRRRPTLPLYAVPSALKGLTSVFGMGTGGSPSL